MEIPSDPKDIRTTEFPDVFTVDFVKVYQKKEPKPAGKAN